jgi:hypothetical protein
MSNVPPTLPDWVEDEAGFSAADLAFSRISTHSAALCYQMFLNELESAWTRGWTVEHLHFIPASDGNSTLEVYFDHVWVGPPGWSPAVTVGYPVVQELRPLGPLDQGVLDAVSRFLEIDVSRFFALRRWLFTPLTKDSLDACREACMGPEVFARFCAEREKRHLDATLGAGREGRGSSRL